MSVSGTRVGPHHLLLRDADGCRHLVRIGSLSVASEPDPSGHDVVVVISGRAITLHDTSIDDVMGWLNIHGVPA
jgi:hypothetical protein